MRYIGSKRNLLPQIEEMLDKHTDGTERTFVDLFAGTNAVATHFARKYQVITNDIMYFSYALAKGTLGISSAPTFYKLEGNGIDNPLTYLSTAEFPKDQIGYAAEQYSPAGNAGRMYFTVQNAQRIDFIRDTIQEWKTKALISEDEFYYLLASLLASIPSVSNITGTYGAYLKKWDKRAYKRLILDPPSSANNSIWKGTNAQFNQDTLDLLPLIAGADIAYIDTPYNTRQYPTNYHVLENIALWDKPSLHGVTGQPDLKDELSDFASKRKAHEAMTNLLNNLPVQHVLLSYSTDGIIPTEELEEIIGEAATGKIDKMEFPYRKYKSKVYTDKGVNELLYYFHPKAYERLSPGEYKIATMLPALANTRNYEKQSRRTKKNTDVVKSEGIIKSPLNYVGGKYRLLPQILPLFPQNVSTFLDLFCGSATVGINASAQRVVFNDVNSRVIELFQCLQSSTTEDVLARIHRDIEQYHLSKTNKEGFLRFRAAYNADPDPIDLYTLVAYSFNYQFRFNAAMEYNNPFGRNRSSFSARMENNLIRFMARLHSIDATFISRYFTEVDTTKLDKDAFVYADPPYLITTGSYNDGTRCFGDWTTTQDQELREMLDSLNSKGIRFAMSNVLIHKGQKNTSLAEWAEKNNYMIHHLSFNYSNSSYNTTRGKSDEVLITNY